ncbi:hypothetical protein Tco_0695353 [Tanacetum coccineum]
MVDVPVKQATPTTLRHPLVDSTVTLIPKTTTDPSFQPPSTQPKIIKIKQMIKKSHNYDSQADDTSLENKVYRLERKVVEMFKFNIQAAIDKSVEARLKQIELPKGVPDFKKIKLEKVVKQNVPKTPCNKTTTDIYDQKSRLYRMMKEVKAFNTHSAHKDLYDALAVSLSIDEGDMDRIFDKDSKKRQRKFDSYKGDKDQDGTSKQGPSQNWFLKLEKTIKAPKDFDDVLRYTFNFSNFIKYHLNKDTLTKADLEGPVNLIRFQQQYIPAEFFFNQDLEYLRMGNLEERKYTTSFTKTKATRYKLYGIEEIIQGLWSPYKVAYDKDTAFRISH